MVLVRDEAGRGQQIVKRQRKREYGNKNTQIDLEIYQSLRFNSHSINRVR
jgi:hypothetical protein